MNHGYSVDSEKLRSAREKAGLTVNILAATAGVEAYQLALVEEQDHVPALTTLRRITLALGIPTHTVIEWRTGAVLWDEAPDRTA